MKGFVNIHSASLIMQSKSQSCILPFLQSHCTFLYACLRWQACLSDVIAACSTADDIDIKLTALVTILHKEVGCKFEFALQQALAATSKPSSENQAQLPLHTSPTAVTVGSSKHGQAAAHQAKRQKVEQPEVVNSKPAAQQLLEARSVAAATKQQLGLTGNTF